MTRQTLKKAIAVALLSSLLLLAAPAMANDNEAYEGSRVWNAISESVDAFIQHLLSLMPEPTPEAKDGSEPDPGQPQPDGCSVHIEPVGCKD